MSAADTVRLDGATRLDVACLALILLSACDPAMAPPAPATADWSGDAMVDAGWVESGDGGLPTNPGDGAAHEDGSLAGDAAPSTDAGELRCRHSPGSDRFLLSEDGFTGGGHVAVGGAVDGVVTAWAESDRGRRTVWVARIPSEGPPHDAFPLAEDRPNARMPAVGRAGDRHVVAWIDNRAGSYELYASPLSPDEGAVPPEPTRITDNRHREEHAAFVSIGEDTVLSWVEVDGGGAVAARPSLPVASNGSPAGAEGRFVHIDSQTGHAMAATPEGSLAASWRDRTSGRILVQLFDAHGSPMGEPQAVSEAPSVSGDVALAMGPEDGAVVFAVQTGGARREVRFRGISATAEVRGPLRVVSASEERAGGPSVAPHRGGFAVAYHARRDGSDEGRVRLAMLTYQGQVIHRMDLGSVESASTETEIRASLDGNLFVTWSDRRAAATELRAARIRCN